MPYQRDVYPPGEVLLSLLNVCLFSSSALKLLHRRRLAMGADPLMRQWPSSEVFIPTEVARAGMTWLSLADFGDVSHCDWFPPTMEEDLRPGDGDVFLTRARPATVHLLDAAQPVVTSARGTRPCTLRFQRQNTPSYLPGGPPGRNETE